MKLIIFSWCIWFDQPTYFVKQEALICQHRSKIVNWEHGKCAISHLTFAWNYIKLIFPNKACFNLSKYDVGLSSAVVNTKINWAASSSKSSPCIWLSWNILKTFRFLQNCQIFGQNWWQMSKQEQIDNCQRRSTGSALGTSKLATLPGAAESSKLH